jgi:hypothetical protein
MNIYAFRLLPGQDLKQGIQAVAKREHIQAGWIMTGVGSLTAYHLRYANQAVGSRGQGHFEIVSLVGTVSIHGSHLHLSLSDGQGHTLGGHLLEENTVYTTVEIVIGSSDEWVFTREHDGSTPYPELQVRKKGTSERG